MLSSVIYSVWIILSARLSGERRDRLGHEAAGSASPTGDAAATTALMVTASAVVFSLGSIASGRSVNPADVPQAAWPIVAIGFLASFLAIQTFYAGARRIGAAQAALLSTIEPLTIVVLAGIVLGQRLEPIQLAGAALIMVGVIVAQTGPRPRGAPEPAMPLDAEAPTEDR